MKLSELAADALDAAQDHRLAPIEYFLRAATGARQDRRILIEQAAPLQKALTNLETAFGKYFNENVFSLIEADYDLVKAFSALDTLGEFVPDAEGLDPLDELESLERVEPLVAAIARGEYSGDELVNAYSDVADVIEELTYTLPEVELGVMADLELVLMN